MVDKKSPLIPDLFTGVRLGSIVLEDGSFSDMGAFDFERLSAAVIVSATPKSETHVFGNSTYNRAAAATGWLTSMDIDYSGGFTVGAGGFLANTSARGRDGQGISVGAMLVGINRTARIGFDELSPETFLGCLRSSMTNERSALGRMAEAIRTISDPATPADEREAFRRLIAAKREFKENYGVGFVSGVVLGGAAAIMGTFDTHSASYMNKWQAGATVQAAAASARGSISGSFGHKNEGAFRESTFKVDSSVIGGGAYVDFESRYKEKFADKMGSELWNLDVASTPSTGDLLTRHEPKLPSFAKKAKEEKKTELAQGFASITTKASLDKYAKAVAFDSWNAANGGGQDTWSDDKKFEAVWREFESDLERDTALSL